MYNSDSIELLTNRIGWDQAVPPTSIVVDSENNTSVSGRFFNSFHQMATVEYVNDCISNSKVDAAGLNAYLAKMRKDSVLEVLNKLFDVNELANYPSGEDFVSVNYDASGYDGLIASKANAFDNPIGYCMAVRCLQLLITTVRSNNTQRSVKASYDFLKAELEGIKDEQGNVIAQGVNTLYLKAIEEAKKILFPTKGLNTRKTLIGKQPW